MTSAARRDEIWEGAKACKTVDELQIYWKSQAPFKGVESSDMAILCDLAQELIDHIARQEARSGP